MDAHGNARFYRFRRGRSEQRRRPGRRRPDLRDDPPRRWPLPRTRSQLAARRQALADQAWSVLPRWQFDSRSKPPHSHPARRRPAPARWPSSAQARSRAGRGSRSSQHTAGGLLSILQRPPLIHRSEGDFRMNLAQAPIGRSELGHVQDPPAKGMRLRGDTKPGSKRRLQNFPRRRREHGATAPDINARSAASARRGPNPIGTSTAMTATSASSGIRSQPVREPDPRRVRRRREQWRPNRP